MSPTPLQVPGVAAMGNENLIVFPAMAGAIPTVSELTTTGTLDITGFWYSGTGNITHENNKVTAPKRVADTRRYQRFGLVNDDMDAIRIMWDPAAASGANGKKAAAVMVAGATKLVAQRLGYDRAVDVAVGQFIRWASVTFGVSNPIVDDSAEENEIGLLVPVIVNTPGWSEFTAIAA